MLFHKTSLNNSLRVLFSDQNEKLEISNKFIWKILNIWKLNNLLQNKPWVKE